MLKEKAGHEVRLRVAHWAPVGDRRLTQTLRPPCGTANPWPTTHGGEGLSPTLIKQQPHHGSETDDCQRRLANVRHAWLAGVGWGHDGQLRPAGASKADIARGPKMSIVSPLVCCVQTNGDTKSSFGDSPAPAAIGWRLAEAERHVPTTTLATERPYRPFWRRARSARRRGGDMMFIFGLKGRRKRTSRAGRR